MIRTLIPSLLLGAVAALPAAAGTVTFDWAFVGNAGNAPDPQTGFGAVSYTYAISKTEVTNAQYTAFLNAVAATDSFGGADPTLYNTSMDSDPRGGITRSGAAGSYTYATKPNMDDKPVNYVSFFDAMRFVNWLHNGQGSGGTETGAYTIGNGVDEVRSADARFWIPSEDEWYKAAYHDASAGTAGEYFDYATGSDSVPTIATANSVGDISNPGVGVVNYSRGADWNGQNGNVTTVGSAGLASASPYGTFDQNGSVFEWNEAVIGSSFRGLRGGSWNAGSSFLRADDRGSFNPSSEFSSVGFRVATVPEPSSLLMGDYNGDGFVDAADYTVWRDQFAEIITPGTPPDGNGDGFVSRADYDIWLANYRPVVLASQGAAAPEPQSLLLLSLLALGGFSCRWRAR